MKIKEIVDALLPMDASLRERLAADESLRANPAMVPVLEGHILTLGVILKGLYAPKFK
jgi:hypothetical protein